MDFDAVERVAKESGGVVAWTRVAEDPMIEDVIAAVVVRAERIDGHQGAMVAVTIADNTAQRTYVMTQESWRVLSERGRHGQDEDGTDG